MNFFECKLCGVVGMSGEAQYQVHLAGIKHKKKMEPNIEYKCSVCGVSMTGPKPYAQHMLSADHLKRTNSTAGTVRTPEPKNTVGTPDLDAPYREKYLKDVIVVTHSQKIEDVFRAHFCKKY